MKQYNTILIAYFDLEKNELYFKLLLQLSFFVHLKAHSIWSLMDQMGHSSWHVGQKYEICKLNSYLKQKDLY